jgi:hypothetical protein
LIWPELNRKFRGRDNYVFKRYRSGKYQKRPTRTVKSENQSQNSEKQKIADIFNRQNSKIT